MKKTKTQIGWLLILSLLASFAFVGCGHIIEDTSPPHQYVQDKDAALADLDMKIVTARKEFRKLPEHTRFQEPHTWELIKTNLEIAEIYSGQNDYIKARNSYAEAFVLLMNLKKLEPIPNDMDGDGIPDDVDKCPEEPENYDGFMDEDGCPEEVKYFVVITSDEEGNLILPKAEITPDTYMIISAEAPFSGIIGVIIPGEYQLRLTLEGYEIYRRPLTVSPKDKQLQIKAIMLKNK